MRTFEVGKWYVSTVVDESDHYEYGCVHDVNVRILDRSENYLTCQDEYGETHRRKIQTMVGQNGEQTEYFVIRVLDNARFYATHISP